ncbi:uncharacterized protein LOC111700642 isoform X2 [Eurytemora carolleeae]|uniref:uncharacterized protein LOC111700642 isoform X2 n=1 Tax=Eurytemora carolleeae TaxID=1294199 RepID=UPI000C76D6BF|nr:uncharacterized protein LOC111700642 isoform X2 [Eurytemora carolleeae]|eukprot:XP_023327392.1 uncharacterized protein LOC111700642 isoform X2 [Eurytemora affinis]
MRKLKDSLLNRRNLGTEREAAKRRRIQQNKDCNLAVVLIFTIFMFLLCNTPRVMSSLIEAYTIKAELACQQKQKIYRGIWYLYTQLVVQFLMLINSSMNLPIYLGLSTHFRTTLIQSFCRQGSTPGRGGGSPCTVQTAAVHDRSPGNKLVLLNQEKSTE